MIRAATEFAHQVTGFFLPRVHHFTGKLDAVGDRFFKFVVVGGELFDQFVEGVGGAVGDRVGAHFGEVLLGLAASFAHFGEQDATVWHAAEAIDEAELGERPNGPLARVPLPWFDAVAVVVLELVVIVVVAFTEGKECHDRAVAGAVAG